MKLQSRVLLILASIWTITCVSLYAESQLTLKHTYNNLEQKLDAQDIHRVQKALDNTISILEVYSASYAQWDDLFQFMKDKNKKFIDVNFVPATFTSGNINFFLTYDQSGKFFYGKAIDLATQQISAPPPELLAYFAAHPSLVQYADISAHHVGMISIPQGYVVISSRPIQESDGKGKSDGALLMGYFFSAEHLKKLSEVVEMNLNIIPLPLPSGNTALQTAYDHLKAGAAIYITQKDAKISYGYTVINDMTKTPIGILQIEIPRTLYSEQLLTMNRYIVIFALMGIVILITMWYLLKFLVLDRIVTLSNQVVGIYSQGKFNSQVSVSGNDEINSMALSINSMLELIALTQDQLKYRIARRNMDLEKLSKLNRNLFAEMSQQKSIETKLREDEKWLKRMAYYDTLTDLPNRVFFSELLINAIIQAQEGHYQIAVLFLDADRFKQINDTYGHEIGDKFLKLIATRLKETIRNSGVAARLAGDEFILFIPRIDSKQALDVVINTLLSNLTAPILIDAITINPMFSIGVSIFPDDGVTIEELISRADLAMYYAKHHEGNIFYYYSDVEHRQTLEPS